MNRIKQISKKLDLFLDKILSIKISSRQLAGSFLGVVILRVFEESFLASAHTTVTSAVNGFLYNFFFFAILYLILWLFLSWLLKVEFQQLTGMILWSFWLLLLPPILDMLKTGGSVFWSFYVLEGLEGLWLQFSTFFGHLPSGIVYYGAKITFIVAIFLVSGVVLVKTKSYIKTATSFLLTYIALFVLGSLPSWLTIGYYFFQNPKKIMQVNAISVAQFFGTPYPIFGLHNESLAFSFVNNLNSAYFLLLISALGGIFFGVQKKKAWAILQNARFPQIIYHTGLLSAGMGMGALIYPQNLQLNVFSSISALVILVSVWLAWEASVIVNDIYDFKIDSIVNQDRPLQKNIFSPENYADLGLIFFGLSLLGGLVIGLKFAALFFVYQLLAWLYSAPPFRLKKFPVLAGPELSS